MVTQVRARVKAVEERGAGNQRPESSTRFTSYEL